MLVNAGQFNWIVIANGLLRISFACYDAPKNAELKKYVGTNQANLEDVPAIASSIITPASMKEIHLPQGCEKVQFDVLLRNLEIVDADGEKQDGKFHAKNVVQCVKQSTETSVHFKGKNPITPPESLLAHMYSEPIYDLETYVTLELLGSKYDQNFGSGVTAGYERQNWGINLDKNLIVRLTLMDWVYSAEFCELQGVGHRLLGKAELASRSTKEWAGQLWISAASGSLGYISFIKKLLLLIQDAARVEVSLTGAKTMSFGFNYLHRFTENGL
ncbi:hypothetical protein MMC31_005707 [Peltigera leucophlebia]|nr:hypothetical protein [Peltigera leucophlebia]